MEVFLDKSTFFSFNVPFMLVIIVSDILTMYHNDLRFKSFETIQYIYLQIFRNVHHTYHFVSQLWNSSR